MPSLDREFVLADTQQSKQREKGWEPVELPTFSDDVPVRIGNLKSRLMCMTFATLSEYISTSRGTTNIE